MAYLTYQGPHATEEVTFDESYREVTRNVDAVLRTGELLRLRYPGANLPSTQRGSLPCTTPISRKPSRLGSSEWRAPTAADDQLLRQVGVMRQMVLRARAREARS